MKPCSNCGSEAVQYVKETHSIHLYRHRDHFQQCQDCGRIEAFRGEGIDPEKGLAFYLPNAELVARRPRCPDHDRAMVPTKCWPAEETTQFKCPEELADGVVCQAVETVEMEAVNAE